MGLTPTDQGRQFLRMLFGDTLPISSVIEIKANLRGQIKRDYLRSPDQYNLTNYHPEARVWFGVCLREEGTDKTYVWAPAAWVDFDKVNKEEKAKELRRFERPPSFIVDSGGGLHAYWKFDRMVDLRTSADFVRELSYGLAKTLGGDPAVHDLARVLGVPGSLNVGNWDTKVYDPPRTVTLL